MSRCRSQPFGRCRVALKAAALPEVSAREAELRTQPAQQSRTLLRPLIARQIPY